MKKFKKGDCVKVGSKVLTVKSQDAEGLVYFQENPGYSYPNDVTPYIKPFSKKIAGYDCSVEVGDDNSMTIQTLGYSYSTTYFGDYKTFLKTSEPLISAYFSTQIDAEVDAILKEFTDNFRTTRDKLKRVVLPHTKDLLLSKVLETFKEQVKDVAELFSDPDTKRKLFSIFK